MQFSDRNHFVSRSAQTVMPTGNFPIIDLDVIPIISLVGVSTGGYRGTGWAANRTTRISVIESDATFCNAVNVRGSNEWVAVTTSVITLMVIGNKKQ